MLSPRRNHLRAASIFALSAARIATIFAPPPSQG
ncbi:hypothetical protein OROGR_004767 [Orobanche gracilis]